MMKSQNQWYRGRFPFHPASLSFDRSFSWERKNKRMQKHYGCQKNDCTENSENLTGDLAAANNISDAAGACCSPACEAATGGCCKRSL